MPRIDARLRIEPCPLDRREAALQILYRRAETRLRPTLIREATVEFAGGELDPAGFWIAQRDGRLIGAMLTQPMAGRVVGIWAPEVHVGFGRGVIASKMVATALADLAARGFRIAQALVDETSPRRAAHDLARGGLPRITRLLYLGRGTATPWTTAHAIPRVEWSAGTPSNRDDFRTTLRATYQDSLDMPELGNVRSMDEVLETHEGGSRFDPNRWRLGTLPGDPRPSVILLLSDQPGRDAWEVTYLGVTPEGRRRGLGLAALKHGLELARPHAKRLELAVDERNAPARKLYQKAGFIPFDRRAVHLAILEPTANPSP